MTGPLIQGRDPRRDAYIAARQRGLSMRDALAEADQAAVSPSPSMKGVGQPADATNVALPHNAFPDWRQPISVGQTLRGAGAEMLQGATLGFGDNMGLVNPQHLQQFEGAYGPLVGGAVQAVPSMLVGGAVVKGVAGGISRFLGLGPRMSNALGSILGSGLVGATQGAGNAKEGEMAKDAVLGGLLGLGTAAGAELVSSTIAAFGTFLDKVPTSKKQQIFDLAVLDRLAGTNATVDDVLNKVDELTTLSARVPAAEAGSVVENGVGKVIRNPTIPGSRNPPGGNARFEKFRQQFIERTGHAPPDIPVTTPQPGTAVAAGASTAPGTLGTLLGSVGPKEAGGVTAGSRLVQDITGLRPADQGTAIALRDAVMKEFDVVLDRKKALQIAVRDMKLAPDVAKAHLDLAEQVLEQRKTLAAELLSLSQRDPEKFTNVVGQIARGRRDGGGLLGQLIAPLTAHANATQSSFALKQLMDQDPMGFMRAIRQRTTDYAAKQRLAAAARGAMAQQLTRAATSPGTSYQER